LRESFGLVKPRCAAKARRSFGSGNYSPALKERLTECGVGGIRIRLIEDLPDGGCPGALEYVRLIRVHAQLRQPCSACDRHLRIGHVYLRRGGTRFISGAKRAADRIGKRKRNTVSRLSGHNSRSRRDGSLKRQEKQKDRHH